jgi:DNA recombination protein RmuC
MVAALGAVVGLIVGTALTALWAQRRSRSWRERADRATTDLAVRDAELRGARDEAERQRQEHATSLENLRSVFEAESARIHDEAIEKLDRRDAQVHAQREQALDRTLKPLNDLLHEYKRNLSEFDVKHVEALGEVRNRAEELLTEQKRSQDETRRLNQLLGRSDHRGRWGEVQLQNVLEASGLRADIDYVLQVTAAGESGRQRPDCVVKLPGGARVALDAKFPFDAFEASLSVDDADERRRLELKHAKDLKAHVKTLRDKAYWEAISPSPEFVVCFVPSDAAVTAAYLADPEIVDYAWRERVLIAGPTNLLSLLWSVALVVRQQRLVDNAERIYDQAGEIVKRIRNVAEPVAKMGRSLDAAVDHFNKMVGSFESRLIPGARELERLGARGTKELPDLSPVERVAARPNPQRWGDDDDLPALEGPVVDATLENGSPREEPTGDE